MLSANKKVRRELIQQQAAEIERLRAALHWLRPYVEGRSVYGRPHALDKIIDAALGQEVSGRDDHRSRNEDGAFSLYEENERLRAALKDFVTDGHCPTCTEDRGFCNTDKCVLRNAEAALEQKSP
jgi:hypothetical protein